MILKTITQCSAFSIVIASNLSAESLIFSKPTKLDIPFNEVESTSFVDYDGDKVTDIISGNFAGNILFRKNIGSNLKPQYEAAVKLKNNGETIKLKHW